MNDFTAWHGLAGGALIGASASFLLLYNGRIAGISGIVGGLLAPARGETRWRAFFVAGLLVGGLALTRLVPHAFGPAITPLPLLVIAGLLVGFGTRLGNGCTSGHGVCGIGRFSSRSLLATCTFVFTGLLTTFVCSHVLGVFR